ncbi:MAG: Molybdate/tungstate transport system permease protein WtpB [Methanosaeta sp. PtaB.Bin018]|jgi:molybdate transport system permease protein|nr:molybdate ABC transporter permease subunit [Methanothrix sp.]OPX75433.1 MAG: Molybdate/tungstate transport system permease protein WtpB [Methanosaeta sp. PtaB.Bin018]OPY46207.1 MAG: Molybdate/tungstate transport system permease protein WtpB [Methanosaeta sp. PtaU1.Bin016]
MIGEIISNRFGTDAGGSCRVIIQSPRLRGSWRSKALKAGLALLMLLTMGFIALPVASLLLKNPLDTVVQTLHDPMVVDALRLSLSTSAFTTVTVVLLGTPLAYINAKFRYPGKEIADSLIDLPVIMPPAVAGIALLMAFGRMGILGHYLDGLGISIAFTTLAVIVAQIFVSSPFYIRQARTSFEDVDISMENAARTLGASRIYTFFHVILPIAFNGLVSGAIMAFARSLGEFGATIMFAGNFQRRTQTMPLAIYTAMQGDLDVALCLALILVIISFLVIVIVKTLTRRMYENVRN